MSTEGGPTGANTNTSAHRVDAAFLEWLSDHPNVAAIPGSKSTLRDLARSRIFAARGPRAKAILVKMAEAHAWAFSSPGQVTSCFVIMDPNNNATPPAARTHPINRNSSTAHGARMPRNEGSDRPPAAPAPVQQRGQDRTAATHAVDMPPRDDHHHDNRDLVTWVDRTWTEFSLPVTQRFFDDLNHELLPWFVDAYPEYLRQTDILSNNGFIPRWNLAID